MLMSTNLNPARYAQNISKVQNSIAQNATRMANRWTNRHTLQMESLQSALISLSTSPADAPKVWQKIWDEACDCAAEDLRDQMEFTSSTFRLLGDVNISSMSAPAKADLTDVEAPLAKRPTKSARSSTGRQEPQIAAE